MAPAEAQSWRMNSTVLVLPLVPVTATTVFGCGPARKAAICASARRGSASMISGRGGTPAGQVRVGRRQHRHGAACHRLGDERPAIDPRARQGGEQVARRDVAAVGGHAGDVEMRHGLPAGST